MAKPPKSATTTDARVRRHKKKSTVNLDPLRTCTPEEKDFYSRWLQVDTKVYAEHRRLNEWAKEKFGVGSLSARAFNNYVEGWFLFGNATSARYLIEETLLDVEGKPQMPPPYEMEYYDRQLERLLRLMEARNRLAAKCTKAINIMGGATK